IHDDNLHSENPQPYLVEKGSNVTLTCTAKGPRKPYEMNWYNNSKYLEKADCTNGTQSSVETCNLTLQWPDVGGKYACRAVRGKECAFTVLELKVADGRQPTITKTPDNQSAHIGSNVTFNCTYTYLLNY
ncbi:unnamed protein product, partial [Porites lobata]